MNTLLDTLIKLNVLTFLVLVGLVSWQLKKRYFEKIDFSDAKSFQTRTGVKLYCLRGGAKSAS